MIEEQTSKRVSPLQQPVRPEETGVGEWCAPGPAATQRREFIVMFDDADRGYAWFENENDAREYFARAEGGGWNCRLLATCPRSA